MIQTCRALKSDDTAQAIMETLKRAKEDDGMKFSEALDYANDKRKFLILRTYRKWKAKQEEESEQ